MYLFGMFSVYLLCIEYFQYLFLIKNFVHVNLSPILASFHIFLFCASSLIHVGFHTMNLEINCKFHIEMGQRTVYILCLQGAPNSKYFFWKKNQVKDVWDQKLHFLQKNDPRSPYAMQKGQHIFKVKWEEWSCCTSNKWRVISFCFYMHQFFKNRWLFTLIF